LKAEAVKQLRTSYDLTQAQVAVLLGLGHGKRVSEIETGNMDVSPAVATKIVIIRHFRPTRVKVLKLIEKIEGEVKNGY